MKKNTKKRMKRTRRKTKKETKKNQETKPKLKGDPPASHKKQQKPEIVPDLRHRFETGNRLIELFGKRKQLLSIEECTDNVPYQDEIDRLTEESSRQSTRSTEDKHSAAQTLARYIAEQKANIKLDKKAAEKSLKIIAVKADGSCLMSAINTAHFAANNCYLLTNDDMRMMAATLAQNFNFSYF